MSYDKDYVEFDEFGIVRVLCMCCGDPVIERTYTQIQSFQDPNRMEKVLAWKRLSNHMELSARMSDGSMTGLPHCTQCPINEPVDWVKVSSLRNRAARLELGFTGKTQEVIDFIMVPQEKFVAVMKEEEYQVALKFSTPEEVIAVAVAKFPVGKEIVIDKAIVKSDSEVV